MNRIWRFFGGFLALIVGFTFLRGLYAVAPARFTLMLILGLLVAGPIIAFRLGVNLLVWTYRNAWILVAAVFLLAGLLVFSIR